MNPLLKLPPPGWFLLFLFLGALAHFFVPSTQIFNFASPTAGITGTVLFALCFWVATKARLLFEKEKTELNPTSSFNAKLVMSGPFHYSRNPIYLSMFMALIGIALIFGTLPLFVSAFLFFIVINFVFIPFEEAKMLRQFGA